MTASTTPEDTPVTINVRSNDTDPDGDPLSIGAFSQPRHGTVATSGGRLVFTPDEQLARDNHLHATPCATRTVDATTPWSPSLSTRSTMPRSPTTTRSSSKDGEPVDIPVVDNDDEVDGEPVTVTVVDQPAHGTVTVGRRRHRHVHAGRGLRRPRRVHLRDLRPRWRLLGSDRVGRGERIVRPAR